MMPSFPVSEKKRQALESRMQALGISEADLHEEFVRSGGAGGQNVNRVATCVMLTHKPTATIIKSQQTRSQGLNRYYARKILCERLENQGPGPTPGDEKAAKIRKQKARRKRRSKSAD